MRFYQFVLLVAAALLASSDSASTSRNSKLVAPDRVLESNTPIERLLRAYPTNEGVEEERGISVNLPSIEKISNAFKSSKTKELQGLLKADESVADAFKTLKLSNMAIGKEGHIETKMVVDLFTSKNFKIWSNHVNKVSKLNKENPEAAMLTALTNVFGEKEVATMILLSKDAWRRGTIDSIKASNVVKRLEKAEFNKWYKSGLDATQVLEKVLKVRMAKIHTNPREKQIWGAYNTWYTATKLNY